MGQPKEQGTEVRMIDPEVTLRWDGLYAFLKGEYRTGVIGSCTAGRIA